MPQLTSHLTGAQWTANGPTTPAQRFFHQYVSAVDSKDYNTGSGLKFYSPTVTFHNQNGAVYHGGDEMWAWMKNLFGVFSKIQHDWIHFVEIELDDKGTSQIYLQGMRNLWIVGDNEGGEPSVSIPVTFIAVVGKSDAAGGRRRRRGCVLGRFGCIGIRRCFCRFWRRMQWCLRRRMLCAREARLTLA